MICKNHPRYSVRRKPTSKCRSCLRIWNKAQQVKNLKPMYRIDSNGLATGTTILDPKGKIVGRVQKATWEADIDKPMTKLTLVIAGATIDAEASNVIIKRKVKKTLRGE